MALAALAALLLGFLLMPGESAMEQRHPFWGRYIAHRGLHQRDRSIPENSLAAFTAAVDAGYAIELDIQLSQDGEVVVFHDDDLLRVCGVDARVDALPLEELQALRLFDTGQPIPTLRQTLALVDGRVPLVVELKTGPRRVELCERAWRILRTYDGDLCIESFDPRIVRWFRRKAPGLLRGQLTDSPRRFNQKLIGFIMGNSLANFYARPHFIAHGPGRPSLLTRFARRFCMNIAWTVQDENLVFEKELENDAIIFEYFLPEANFLEPGVVYEQDLSPDAPNAAPAEDAPDGDAAEAGGDAGGREVGKAAPGGVENMNPLSKK